MSFENETWIVTGASRGIGSAIADALWSRGARLILNARNAQRLSDKATPLRNAPDAVDRLRVAAGDIGDPATSAKMADLAAELGGPIGVIHNAGVAGAGPKIWEASETEYESIMGASLGGGLNLVRALVPMMLEQDAGTFVFVGSGIADHCFPGVGPYGIAKAAEEYLSRQVAAEAPCINSLVWRPGVVDTDMQTEARSGPSETSAVFQGFLDNGQLITPQAAAEDLVMHLSGDRASLSGKMVSVPR